MTQPIVRFPAVFRPLDKPARWKGAWGGRGSGKSHYFAGKAVLRCIEKPTRIVCLREVQNSIKDSVKQLIEDKIEAYGVAPFFTVTDQEIRGLNGSLIIFRGLQNHTASSIKSLEGFHVAWVEEAQTITQTSLDLLTPTIREPGSELWFSWNPVHRKDPVDVLMRQRPPADAVVVEAQWRDNPWFPAELRADMEHMRSTDPEKAAHVWDGAYRTITEGAYYALQIAAARRAGRIGHFPADPALPVNTAWDLGIGDATAIWLWQAAPDGIRLVDYIEGHGKSLPWYAAMLRARRDVAGVDFVPHDARARELGTGRTRVETMLNLGLRPEVVPQHTVEDGINAVRQLLPLCRFDGEHCGEGLDALEQYRADYDDRGQMFKDRPVHNWASHGADAFRYMAMAYRALRHTPKPAKPTPKPGQVTLPGVPEPERGGRIVLR